MFVLLGSSQNLAAGHAHYVTKDTSTYFIDGLVELPSTKRGIISAPVLAAMKLFANSRRLVIGFFIGCPSVDAAGASPPSLPERLSRCAVTLS